MFIKMIKKILLSLLLFGCSNTSSYINKPKASSFEDFKYQEFNKAYNYYLAGCKDVCKPYFPTHYNLFTQSCSCGLK